MDKALQFSFIRPQPIKVRIPNMGPKVDFVTGETARALVETSLNKGEMEYQALRQGAVALFSPLDNMLPSKLENIQKGVTALMSSIEVNIVKEPLYILISTTLLETNYISSDKADRVMWLYHLLSLINGEVGPTLNPRKESSGTTVWQGKRVPFHVYGALQQTPANWDNAIIKFQDSASGQAVVKSGVLSQLAHFVRLPVDHLLDPGSEYGAKYMPIYQTVPILGQLLGLRDNLNNQFTFVKGQGWTPKNRTYLNSPNWKYLSTKYPLLIKNFYGGRQMLLTMMHINGGGFLTLDKLGNHLERVPQDVRMLAGLIGNTRLRKVIEAMNSTYDVLDKFASMLGDPTHTDPTEVSKAKAAAAEHRSIPFESSTYGWRMLKGKKDWHPGVDLAVYKKKVHSVGPGKVTYAQFNNGGYGNLVKILHDNGYETYYAHLSKLDVKKGDRVTDGQVIGVSGNTGGKSTGYHLHFEVRLAGNTIDPTDPSKSPFEISNLIS